MRRMVLILLICLLLSSCKTDEPAPEPQEPKESLADILSEMPEDFEIRFEGYFRQDQRNIMDTRTGLLQKDLIQNGVITGEFTPSETWKKEIYEKILDSGVLEIDKDMVSANLTTTDEEIEIEPNQWFRIECWMNKEHYLITGDWTAFEYAGENDQAEAFKEVVGFLQQKMWNLKEWKELPEAEGGYE